MRRCPKSVVDKLLFWQKICVQSSNGIVYGKIPQFQRALIHSPSRQQHPAAANRYGYLGRHADFARYELQLSRRFVHATGAYQAAQRDYYEILGVSKDATHDEIKKAFHALAKKYHPDGNKNNPSAKRKFQEIREAYETLKDPPKKTNYDRMKESSKTKGTRNAEDFKRDWSSRHAHGAQFSGSFHKIFSEIFENETVNMGGDIQVELVLTFSEATKGCTKHLSFDADVPCDSCDGQGHPLDAETIICPTCRGIGRVTIPPFTTTCVTCKGVGRIIKEYCTSCGGSGVCKGVRDVRVTVPAGVDAGDTIRVPKAGNSGGWGNTSGDLHIKLKVAEDPVFSRKGADLYVDKYISFTQAILGGNIEVPTLAGKKQLIIPKGVQHGQLVKLRGKGLPKSGFLVVHGDQYVRFCINLPLNVTERQQAILEEFEKEQMNEMNTSSAGSCPCLNNPGAQIIFSSHPNNPTVRPTGMTYLQAPNILGI
ncbi:DNAJ heat shock family protein [Perilla frutescens var. frutescens]|nr:DNAJ heat shock family protein [Perilla frutescens var. frutescens]